MSKSSSSLSELNNANRSDLQSKIGFFLVLFGMMGLLILAGKVSTGTFLLILMAIVVIGWVIKRIRR